MAVALVQWPGYAFVEGLNRQKGLLSDMTENGVDHFALVISLLAFDNIFWRHSAL